MAVERVARLRVFPTGEPRGNASSRECLGYGREVRQGGCQRNRAAESSRFKEWLPEFNPLRSFSNNNRGHGRAGFVPRHGTKQEQTIIMIAC
jgi:hypothetical protein